jgi:hypothetical protein
MVRLDHPVDTVDRRDVAGDSSFLHVLGGQHGNDAIHRLSRARVDPVDLRVGVLAPKDRHVEHAPLIDVVDERPPSRQQLWVLPAIDRVADAAGLIARAKLS